MTALTHPAPTATETNRPAIIPVDPESLDATRPDDLDVCGICMGDGAIQVPTGFLYDREFDSEPCWACHGTGQRGAA